MALNEYEEIGRLVTEHQATTRRIVCIESALSRYSKGLGALSLRLMAPGSASTLDFSDAEIRGGDTLLAASTFKDLIELLTDLKETTCKRDELADRLRRLGITTSE